MKNIFIIVIFILYDALLSQTINDYKITKSGYYPDLTIDNSGRIHVVWLSLPTPNKIQYAVYESHFDGLSGSLSIPIPNNSNNMPHITNSDSIFSIVWGEADIHTMDIKGTFFTYPNLSDIPRINYSDDSDLNRFSPQSCFLTDSTYVVVWSGNGNIGGSQYNLYAQLCSVSNGLVDNNFLINEHDQERDDVKSYNPHILSFPNNQGFVAIWIDNYSGKDEIYGRIFDTQGIPINPSFLIADNSSLSNLLEIGLAMYGGGNFAITWSGVIDANWVIQKRWFDSAGNPKTDIITVTKNTNNVAPFSSVDIAVQEDGKSIVIWEEKTGNYTKLYSQRFDSLDNPLGEQFSISTALRETNQYGPKTILRENTITTVWQESDNYIWGSSISFINPPTAILENQSELGANKFELHQNYPNPFNPSTKISYQIPGNGFVDLVVYNALGQKVAQLVNQYQSSGKYSVQFNANNLPSGVYFYKLESSSFIKVNKMLLLR